MTLSWIMLLGQGRGIRGPTRCGQVGMEAIEARSSSSLFELSDVICVL
jgi:hypothetical protein